MNLNNFTISTRLAFSTCMTLLILLVVAIFSGIQLNSVGKNSAEIIDIKVASLINVLEAQALMQENGRRITSLILTIQKEARVKDYAAVEVNKKKITTLLKAIEEQSATQEEKNAIEKLKDSRAKFVLSFSKVAALIEQDVQTDAVEMLNKEAFPALQDALNDITTLVNLEKLAMEKNGESIKQSISFSSTFSVIFSAIAVIFSALFAVLIAKSIVTPLNNAVNIAICVAEGDLTTRIETGGSDETGQLLKALFDMNKSLVATIGQVNESVDTIATASSQIASGNADLSSRTESQASSLEQTAASMEELTSIVKKNADNAHKANQLVVSASDVAIRGGHVVGDVVSTMGSIKTSSGKIVEIISVIDGIAFQTNILALNAAVEAARAGEQGRGFAVVASEVRNLAQRSASAAREIKTLIDNSVEQVELGSKLVDQAGRTMEEIVSSVKHVAEIMSEIAAASQEQSSGIEQVNRAISHMDEMTQQNAALVEQAAAAAESMRDQAKVLANTVQIFKLSHSSKKAEQRTGKAQRFNTVARQLQG